MELLYRTTTNIAIIIHTEILTTEQILRLKSNLCPNIIVMSCSVLGRFTVDIIGFYVVFKISTK